MAYKPNFNDPRVEKRIKKSLGFVRSCFTEHTAKAWSSRHLDGVFGNTSRPLGAWIKRKLLVKVSNDYSMDHGNCKTYRLNIMGYQELKSLYISTATMTDDQLSDEWIIRNFRGELDSKQFKYRDKAHRRWHGLQNVNRSLRSRALKNAGFALEYDISACAPTTLYQQVKIMKKSRKKLPFIEQLLNNKHEIRNRISEELQVDLTTTKKIITAMFCGAHISNDSRSAIGSFVNHNTTKIQWLKTDPYIQGLKKDIKKVWSVVKVDIPARESVNPRTGVKKISRRLNAKQKWDYYFQQERRVMDVVERILRESGNNCFLIHDGWASCMPCDLDDIKSQIFQESGYQLVIDTNYPHPYS